MSARIDTAAERAKLDVLTAALAAMDTPKGGGE